MTEKEVVTIVARVLKSRRLGGLNEFRPEAQRIIDALREADALRLAKAKKLHVLKPVSKKANITLSQARAAVRAVAGRRKR